MNTWRTNQRTGQRFRVRVSPNDIEVGSRDNTFGYDDFVLGNKAIIYDFRGSEESTVGKGLGRIAYEALENKYRRLGVKTIELEDVLEEAEGWR